jgi:TPR repeat protein
MDEPRTALRGVIGRCGFVPRCLALIVFLYTALSAQDIRAALDAYARRDYIQALSQARPLAEQGHAVAQGLLGVMYEYGQGVSKDYREALRWYHKAAEQGMAPAQFSVGEAYALGREVTKDDQEAVRWYRRSAEQNYAAAQLKLGAAYFLGRGVPRNLVQAYMWLSLASEKEHQEQAAARQGRDEVERKMTADELKEARRLAAEFKVNSGQ